MHNNINNKVIYVKRISTPVIYKYVTCYHCHSLISTTYGPLDERLMHKLYCRWFKSCYWNQQNQLTYQCNLQQCIIGHPVEVRHHGMFHVKRLELRQKLGEEQRNLKHSVTFILMMDMLSAEKTHRIFNDVGHSWKDRAIQMIIQEGVECSWLSHQAA